MAGLKLSLLGGFHARLGTGAEIALPTRKAALLLAYLAMPPGEARAREKLTGLLWSDRAEPQARGSLRQTLTVLRQCLDGVDPPPLVVDRASVALDRAAVDVDVAAFQELAESDAREDLERAAALYQGALLDGATVPDPAFEEWLTIERARLHEIGQRALSKLLAAQAEAGDTDSAIETALRLVGLDPLGEDAHRALMRLYAKRGQRHLALKQYESCVDVLQRELGVKPEPETTRLYEDLLKGEPPPTPAAPPAVEKEPVPVFGDRPAIAVLPFENLSGDPSQDYFADGITEDVITGLSYWRWFPVIARNSTLVYKGKAMDATQVGRELGARYLLHGSVRKADEKVRISVHLIDAATGHQCWAQRYDSELSGIFAVQDEISERIVANIEPELGRAEERRAYLKRPKDLTAWDHILRARHAKARGGHGYGSKDGNAEARRHLARAIELDPTSSEALSLLALWDWQDAIQGWAEDTEAALTRAQETARQAVTLDDGNWLAHAVLGLSHVFGRGDPESGVEMMERAIEFNPSAAMAYHTLGCALEFAGRPGDALRPLKTVFALDPRYRNSAALLADLSLSHLLLGDTEEAIAYGKKAVETQPDYVRARQRLAAALALAGRRDEARSALAEVMRLQPNFSLGYVDATYPFSNPEHRAMFIEGLRGAGLTA